MFCGKCGNVIDDNAKQCPFCGTPVEEMQSQPAQPQQSAPSVNNGGAVLNLDPKIVNYIKLGLIGVIGLLALLVFIASIVVLGTLGSAFRSVMSGSFGAVFRLPGVIGFARVTAILCFSFCVLGVVFVVLTKQKFNVMYVCAGLSVLMFIFNFVMGSWLTASLPASIIVAAIFLLASASSMLGVIARTILKEVLPTFKK